MDGKSFEPGGDWFATTHWTVVLGARAEGSPEAQAALEEFCQTYWRPVYAFIRRDGYPPAEAQDLTQQFFLKLVEKHYLKHLKDRRGKFRSFLLTFLKHFLSDERDRNRARKRGGGQTLISLDQFEEEDRLVFEPPDSLTPEQEFERRWARNLIERAYRQLEREYGADGHAALFERLKDAEPGDREAGSYAQLGAILGMTESAVKAALHRMRQRHREILRTEIAQTVGGPADVQDEIRYFIKIMGN